MVFLPGRSLVKYCWISKRKLIVDDLELPTLTPETFLYQRMSHLPERQTWTIARMVCGVDGKENI